MVKPCVGVLQVGFEDGSERSIARDELWLPDEELPKGVRSRMVSSHTIDTCNHRDIRDTSQVSCRRTIKYF